MKIQPIGAIRALRHTGSLPKPVAHSPAIRHNFGPANADKRISYIHAELSKAIGPRGRGAKRMNRGAGGGVSA